MNATLNTIKTAFATMAASAMKYSEAAESIRYVRARGEVTEQECREMAQAALLAKVPGYAEQVHPESGKPAKGSAFQRAVSRMMRDTNPDRGEQVNHEAKAVKVPRDLQAKVTALLETYDVKVIREALKRAA